MAVQTTRSGQCRPTSSSNVSNWEDDDEVADYLAKIVNKQAYDKSGLVYGMGHAVYTLSDPRAIICKKLCEEAGRGNGIRGGVPALLESIERLAPEVILREKRHEEGYVREHRYVLWLRVLHDGHSRRPVHAPVCLRPHGGLGCAPFRGDRLRASASSARHTRARAAEAVRIRRSPSASFCW